MTEVTLVYPYFQPPKDKSIFRFPPLGLGYLAAYLKEHRRSVALVDCTFLSREEALGKVRASNPRIIGVYAMFSMKRHALEMARLLRGDCELLVAGGPLPTTQPGDFLQDFDLAVLGEGEETLLDLLYAWEGAAALSEVRGVAYREGGEVKLSHPRRRVQNLDNLPFPARELFDNDAYKRFYWERHGYTITSMITSRGCPFNCDFCSQPVFGGQFRMRSPGNVVDEVETVLQLGYHRIWFADDCFTLDRSRLIDICNEIIRRGIRVDWECLSRVDTIDRGLAGKMREAGCVRVFFGVESGNDAVLALMNKRVTTAQASEAVTAAKKVGLQVGAFFILGYPGENDETVLDTVRFASALPLDYLSFTLPYPIPGTPLHERVKDRMVDDNGKEPRRLRFAEHTLLYRSSFSEAKLTFALLKGMVQFNLRKYLKTRGYNLVGKPLEKLTDFLFKHLR